MSGVLMQEVVKLIIALVITALTGLITSYVPRLVAAAESRTAALLGEKERDALYASVKIALNVLKANGTTPESILDDILEVGVGVAQRYLSSIGVTGFAGTQLRDLILAEYAKQSEAAESVPSPAPVAARSGVTVTQSEVDAMALDAIDRMVEARLIVELKRNEGML